MPRSRGSEMPQRQSTRSTVQLRTSSSNSDPLHNRPVTNKSPKVGDRRSPKGIQSDPLNQKKLGTRIAGLESQLGQAQEELKILKDQVASAEAAKKEAQQELEKKTPKPLDQNENQGSNGKDTSDPFGFADENHRETDVFEVPVEKVSVGSKVELNELTDQENQESKPPVSEPEKPSFEDLALKNDEIISLKEKLEQKGKEIEVFSQENESLKSQLNEVNLEISSAKSKEEEMNLRLTQLTEELEEGTNSRIQLNEKLEDVEREKEALEVEMKKLRVQTEQWRKAADAAASVLAGGVEMKGRRVSERCGSMDNHVSGAFGMPVNGYNGFADSPVLGDDSDDGFGNGKRKGIRVFGDLWKKKGQK